jgi:hypothetical protein
LRRRTRCGPPPARPATYHSPAASSRGRGRSRSGAGSGGSGPGDQAVGVPRRRDAAASSFFCVGVPFTRLRPAASLLPGLLAATRTCTGRRRRASVGSGHLNRPPPTLGAPPSRNRQRRRPSRSRSHAEAPLSPSAAASVPRAHSSSAVQAGGPDRPPRLPHPLPQRLLVCPDRAQRARSAGPTRSRDGQHARAAHRNTSSVSPTQRNGRSVGRDLQSELVDGCRFPSFEHAEHEVLHWIGFYNEERLHEALADLPPTEYEESNYKTNNTLTSGDHVTKPPANPEWIRFSEKGIDCPPTRAIIPLLLLSCGFPMDRKGLAPCFADAIPKVTRTG